MCVCWLQAPKSWEFELLCQPVSEQPQFYPLADFSIYRSAFTKPQNLRFPSYLHLSKNYFDRKWSWPAKTIRRIKNVLVLVEFTPNVDEVAEAADPGTPPADIGLSRDQEAHMLRIFSLFVATGETGIKFRELQQFLLAADVQQADTESGFLEGLLERIFGEKMESWDFLTIKDMMCNKYFYRLHAGRHFVAVSLAEAETLRSILHAAQGESLTASNHLSMALWYGDTMLDCSDNFTPAHVYQETFARQCYRFFDSQYEYTDFEMRMLLRSVQSNSLPQRYRYYENIRHCRRRSRAKWQNLPVRQIFELQDEYRPLEERAAVVRVGNLMRQRGMASFDAFRAFNYHQTGVLSCAELYGGLTWLGLDMSPVQLHSIFQIIDVNGDGAISLEEFKRVFESTEMVHESLLDLDVVWDGDFVRCNRAKPFPPHLAVLCPQSAVATAGGD